MPAGRPPELTAELVSEARRLIRCCLYVEMVADLLGIERLTLREWVKRGARLQRRQARAKKPLELTEHEELCVQFSTAIKSGLGAVVRRCLGRIGKAGKDQWQANAWLLERRLPDLFGSDRAELRALRKELAELRAEVHAQGQRAAPRTPPHQTNGHAHPN